MFYCPTIRQSQCFLEFSQFLNYLNSCLSYLVEHTLLHIHTFSCFHKWLWISMRLGIVLWWHCKQNSWTKKRILSGCTKHVYVTMTRWGHPIWLGCKLAESKIFLCVISWSHHAQFIMGTLSWLHKCTKSMKRNQGSNHAKLDFNSSQLRSQTSYLILTFNALSSIFCPHSLDSWSNPYSSVLTFYFLKNYSQANEKTIAWIYTKHYRLQYLFPPLS